MAMPKRLLSIATVLALATAGSATAQQFPENVPQTPWFREFQRELRAAWLSPDVPTRGPVRFVVGNGQWLAGTGFKNGNEWLALACGAAGCRLVPATLSVKTKRSRQQLHFQAAAAVNGRVIAWFPANPASPWLAPGPVPTHFGAGGQPKETGRGSEEALIDLPGGETAILMPMLLSDPAPPAPLPPALLLLRVGERRQLLLGQLGQCTHSFRSRDYLLWSGDLDRDGKPDFLISFVDGDGPIHLYLSSTAKPKRLVGLAGVYNPPSAGVECDRGEEP